MGLSEILFPNYYDRLVVQGYLNDIRASAMVFRNRAFTNSGLMHTVRFTKAKGGVYFMYNGFTMIKLLSYLATSPIDTLSLLAQLP